MKRRVLGYLGGILEEECVALYRRFSMKKRPSCAFTGGPDPNSLAVVVPEKTQ